MEIVLLLALLESLALALWITSRWHVRNLQSKALATLPRRSLIPPVITATTTSQDTAHPVFISEWRVENQGDDRRPMIGSVAESIGSPSARRSSARRSHQANYKEWSQQRHD